jgi:hypothetical protein
MADVTYSPRDYFLKNLERWELGIPLQTQWTVRIVPENPNVSSFLGTIGSVFTRIDYSGFSIPSSITSNLFNSTTQSQEHGLGLYFAQGVSLPRESYTPIEVGTDNSGGYLRGVAAGDRIGIKDKSLSTSLLETNLDFCDGIIKPWIIAVAYKGLIDLGEENSIKSTIYVDQFTRGSSTNPKPLRKQHTFTGCVPFEIDGKSLSFDGEQINTHNVSWIFSRYVYKLSSL